MGVGVGWVVGGEVTILAAFIGIQNCHLTPVNTYPPKSFHTFIYLVYVSCSHGQENICYHEDNLKMCDKMTAIVLTLKP